MSAVIPPFANHLPVHIRFGEGTAMVLPDLIAELGARNPAILVDRGITDFNPAAGDLLARLNDIPGQVPKVCERPAGEPTVATVDEVTDMVREATPDLIVALGGGSVIDTAKAARLCLQLERPFAEAAAAPDRPEPTVPLVAIPTTAGTGSEVSGGAVVTDPGSGRKAGIAHPNLRAQYALVDPALTYSMTPRMTANTGIDALAQAIAGVIARVRTPVAQAIGLEAIRLAGESLVPAYRDGRDPVARSRMACASLMAGLTMNLSDCTAEHSMGQAIAGIREAPHGLTVGLVLAETLERERRFVPALLERVADALGESPDSAGDGTRAVRAVRRILAELAFPVLSDLGIGGQDVGLLADLAMADQFVTLAPEPWSREEVCAAYHAALRLTTRNAELHQEQRWSDSSH